MRSKRFIGYVRSNGTSDGRGEKKTTKYLLVVFEQREAGGNLQVIPDGGGRAFASPAMGGEQSVREYHNMPLATAVLGIILTVLQIAAVIIEMNRKH